MLSDGVCACNGQECAHTRGLRGLRGGGWLAGDSGRLPSHAADRRLPEPLGKLTGRGRGPGDQARAPGSQDLGNSSSSTCESVPRRCGARSPRPSRVPSRRHGFPLMLSLGRGRERQCQRLTVADTLLSVRHVTSLNWHARLTRQKPLTPRFRV